MMHVNRPPPPADKDTFRFLITTDNHLGFMDRDNVRKNDSFLAFEECLEHGRVTANADAVLLCGDLFHDNKPTLSSLNSSMALFRRYCFGSKDIEFEILSDTAAAFKNTKIEDRYQLNGVANFQDPNINVAMPVFTIHGNHDDPINNISAIDLLQTAGLVNYFGRVETTDDIVLTPILMRKGNTYIALYGLGNVRDERLNRAFRDGKIQFRRPREDDGRSYFTILLLHQNRGFRTADSKNGIEEKYLKGCGIDLVIWGNEHDQIMMPTRVADSTLDVCQPGSSIHTAMPLSENPPVKGCGILDIRASLDPNTGKMIPAQRMTFHALKNVRPIGSKIITLHDLRFVPHSAADIRNYKEKQRRLKDNANGYDFSSFSKKIFSFGQLLERQTHFESEEEKRAFDLKWSRAKVLDKKKDAVEEFLRVFAHNLSLETRLPYAKRFFEEKRSLCERLQNQNQNNNNNEDDANNSTNNTTTILDQLHLPSRQELEQWQAYFERVSQVTGGGNNDDQLLLQENNNNDGNITEAEEVMLSFALQFDVLHLPLLKISIDFAGADEEDLPYPDVSLLRLSGDLVSRAANAGEVFKKITEREKALNRLRRMKLMQQQQNNILLQDDASVGGGRNFSAAAPAVPVVETDDIRSKIAGYLNANTKDQCTVLPEMRISEAVYDFAEKGEKDAIAKTISEMINGTHREIWKKFTDAQRHQQATAPTITRVGADGQVHETINIDGDDDDNSTNQANINNNNNNAGAYNAYTHHHDITADQVRQFAMEHKNRENAEMRALHKGFLSAENQRQHRQQQVNNNNQNQNNMMMMNNNTNNNDDHDKSSLKTATTTSTARTFSIRDEIRKAEDNVTRSKVQSGSSSSNSKTKTEIVQGNMNRRGRRENDDDDDLDLDDDQQQQPVLATNGNNNNNMMVTTTPAAAPKPKGKGSKTTNPRTSAGNKNNNNKNNNNNNNSGFDVVNAQQTKFSGWGS